MSRQPLETLTRTELLAYAQKCLADGTTMAMAECLRETVRRGWDDDLKAKQHERK